MPIVDEVPLLPTQPWHPLYQAVGIPDFHLLDSHPHFDHLADQPRRDRISVVPDLDGAPPAHPDSPTLLRLQPPRRQPSQHGQFSGQRLLSWPVALL